MRRVRGREGGREGARAYLVSGALDEDVVVLDYVEEVNLAIFGYEKQQQQQCI